MIELAHFPGTDPLPEWTGRLVEVFREHEPAISSARAGPGLRSEEVLDVLTPSLHALGFRIEKLEFNGETTVQPGMGRIASRRHGFHFDVYHPEWMCCLAIEDGHDWSNIREVDDLVEPIMVSEADTLCLAAPHAAEETPGGGIRESEFVRMRELAEMVYGHTRRSLPRRLVIIGY